MPDDIQAEPTGTTDNQATEPVATSDNQQTNTAVADSQDKSQGTTENAGSGTYRPEELKDVPLESMDYTKLPEEIKPYYNSMRAAQTKANQALAEQRQQMENMVRQVQMQMSQQQTMKDPVEVAYQNYISNPQGFLNGLYSQVAALRSADPLGADFAKSQAAAAELEKYALLFSERARQDSDRARYSNELGSKITMELHNKVPGFTEKAPKLQEFAKSRLGMSDQLIGALVDVNRMGMLVPEVVSVINKVYDILEVGQKVKDGTQPPRGNAPGRSINKNSSLDSSLQALADRAKKTGETADIAKYLDARNKSINRR